jgi:hypothetical protein
MHPCLQSAVVQKKFHKFQSVTQSDLHVFLELINTLFATTARNINDFVMKQLQDANGEV